MLDRLAGWLARVWPSLFAYQILAETVRRDGLEDLVQQTVGQEAPAPATDEAPLDQRASR